MVFTTALQRTLLRQNDGCEIAQRTRGIFAEVRWVADSSLAKT